MEGGDRYVIQTEGECEGPIVAQITPDATTADALVIIEILLRLLLIKFARHEAGPLVAQRHRAQADRRDPHTRRGR